MGCCRWFCCLTNSHDNPFHHQKFDIIAVQETWTDQEIILQGYNNYWVKAKRGEGLGRLKGGLALLISETLNFKCIEKPAMDSRAMAIVLKSGEDSLILINVKWSGTPISLRTCHSLLWSIQSKAFA